MSLTSFVNFPDVKAKIKPLRPGLPRTISATIKVEPKSNNYAIVGTAFDYLLRFEIQRRVPHAVTGGWTAEMALARLRPFVSGKCRVWHNPLKNADPNYSLPPEDRLLPFSSSPSPG